MLQNLKNI